MSKPSLPSPQGAACGIVFDSADLLQVLGEVQMPHLEPRVLSSLPVEIFALIKVLCCHVET